MVIFHPPPRLLPPNQRIMKILELDRISEIVKGTPFLSKEKDIGPEPLRELGKVRAVEHGGVGGIDFAYCPQSFAWFSDWVKYCKQFFLKKLSLVEKVRLQQ